MNYIVQLKKGKKKVGEGAETGMTHVVMDESWTPQYELMFSILWKQIVTPRIDVHTCRVVCRHTSLLCRLRVSEKQGRILASSTPSLASRAWRLQQDELWILGEMADCKAGAGIIQDGPEDLSEPERKQVRKDSAW